MLQIQSQSEKVDEKLCMLKNHHSLTIHLLAVGRTDLTVYVHPVSIHHRHCTPVRKDLVLFIAVHHLSRKEGMS